jgi:hypothetical protein
MTQLHAGTVSLEYHNAEHGSVRLVMGVRRGLWHDVVVNPARICISIRGPVPEVHRDVEVQVEIQTRVPQTRTPRQCVDSILIQIY